MNRKIYFAPSAELMMLVPTEGIAWQWTWDSYGGKETASITGTNIPIFETQDKPWEYNGADTPY